MFDEYKKALIPLVAYKSISADPVCKEEVQKTAIYLQDLLQKGGFQTELFTQYANPIVFGSIEVDQHLPTCLIYGHYDVQPAEKEEGWNSDPFTLREKDNKLFARGVMDDKGQLLLHIIAIQELIKHKQLGYNIKFLFEGNEEVGSPAIEHFISKHTDLLHCDFVMISDGELTLGKPTIELGFRGILNATVNIITAGNELHSGLYGGSVPNAAEEVSILVTKLFDKQNKVTIPGFYDDVLSVDTSISIPFAEEHFRKNTGAKVLKTEPRHDFFTQTGQRPSIEVTGIHAGYTGVGYKNSIPHKATVKINFRLVKNQDPEKIEQLFRKFLKETLPVYIDFAVSFDDHNHAVRIDYNNAFVTKAKKVLTDVFGERPLHRYVGGSEPVVLYFDKYLKKPIVLVPFANEDGAMHGVNENFAKENIEKGLLFSREFFREK
ncbi:MAG TPA: M20/M25/M40 family metallo-hydrolase [Patescibacteria group bacterium]|nr:M20/M25/M40 family metallo-hydrolase [Patescibacteria group bacterium]